MTAIKTLTEPCSATGPPRLQLDVALALQACVCRKREKNGGWCHVWMECFWFNKSMCSGVWSRDWCDNNSDRCSMAAQHDYTLHCTSDVMLMTSHLWPFTEQPRGNYKLGQPRVDVYVHLYDQCAASILLHRYAFTSSPPPSSLLSLY